MGFKKEETERPTQIERSAACLVVVVVCCVFVGVVSGGGAPVGV